MASIETRKSRDGSTAYRVRVRLLGHPERTATFERRTDAREWANEIEADLRRGRYVPTTEAMRRTVAQAIDRYLRDTLPNKRHNRDAVGHAARLRWWREQIGDYALANVTPDVIAAKRLELATQKTRFRRQRSGATVNRYLANLSHVFTVAAREWRWIEQSPFRNVSRLAESLGRERFLSDDERVRLLKACQRSSHQDLYVIVMLALSTGMRRGEILSLQWEHVDIAQGRIRLQHTKNNERRTVPLAGAALELMRDRAKVRQINTRLVFPRDKRPTQPADITSAWLAAVKVAQLDNFRFHDLRHSAASYLAMSGATLTEIAAILGHKTLAMVKRYAHLTDHHTAKVVERMNQRVFANQ